MNKIILYKLPLPGYSANLFKTLGILLCLGSFYFFWEWFIAVEDSFPLGVYIWCIGATLCLSSVAAPNKDNEEDVASIITNIIAFIIIGAIFLLIPTIIIGYLIYLVTSSVPKYKTMMDAHYEDIIFRKLPNNTRDIMENFIEKNTSESVRYWYDDSSNILCKEKIDKFKTPNNQRGFGVYDYGYNKNKACVFLKDLKLDNVLFEGSSDSNNWVYIDCYKPGCVNIDNESNKSTNSDNQFHEYIRPEHDYGTHTTSKFILNSNGNLDEYIYTKVVFKKLSVLIKDQRGKAQ